MIQWTGAGCGEHLIRLFNWKQPVQSLSSNIEDNWKLKTLNPPNTLAQQTTHSNHRWIVLGVGVSAQASFSLSYQGIPATGPLLQNAYHLTLDQLGLILGVISLGVASSEVIWGMLTDRLGDRFVLLLGLLSTGAIFALLAIFGSPRLSYIPEIALFGGGLFILGIMGGSINGASGKAVMTWFQDGERGFAMSVRQTAVPIGGGIGAILLPWLALHYGFVSVFSALALTSLGAACATWVWLTTPSKTSTQQTILESITSKGLKNFDIWRLFIASGLLTVPQFAILTFSAIYLINQTHVGIGVTSAVIFTIQILTAITRVWSGRWTDRHNNRRTFVRTIAGLTGISLILLQILIGLGHYPYAEIFLIVCAGVLGSAWHGVAFTEIAVMAGASRVGTALGIENTAIFVAAFLTPVSMPFLLRWLSWGEIWGAIGVVCLIALMLAPGRSKI
jgi:sugar phosphate permease